MDKRAPNNASYYSHPDMHEGKPTTRIKPLYMLIKVDVDADIVRSNTDANFYCENHCNSLQYALVDFYYPDKEEYPYIAK